MCYTEFMLSANKTACDVRALFDKSFSDEEIAVELGISIEVVRDHVGEYLDDMWDNHLDFLAECEQFNYGEE